jgi:hypothetical protein
MGCGGRGSVIAQEGMQGGLSIEEMSVSIHPARGRTALLPLSLKLRWTCTCYRSLLAKAGRVRQSRVVLAPVAGVKPAEVHDPNRVSSYLNPLVKQIPTVCGSLREVLENLDKDRAFLKNGGVFDDDFIDSYIELKMSEVERFEMTPHPVEFEMYYSL